MKSSLVVLCMAGASLLCSTGCFYRSDAETLSSAHAFYQLLCSRYEAMLSAQNDELIGIWAEKFGSHNSVTGWSGLWNDILKNDHLTSAEGAPLHRTCYFIESDISEAGRHRGLLEGRGLGSLAVCEKIEAIRSNLSDIVYVIKSSPEYTKEGQFIESRKLQHKQLEESRKQRRLLEELADKKSPKEKSTFGALADVCRSVGSLFD